MTTVTTAKGRSLNIERAPKRRLEAVKDELQELVDAVPLYRRDAARAMELASRLDAIDEVERALPASLTEEEIRMLHRLRDVLNIEGELEERWEREANRY